MWQAITNSTFKSSVDTTDNFISVSSSHAQEALVHLLVVSSYLLFIQHVEATTGVAACVLTVFKIVLFKLFVTLFQTSLNWKKVFAGLVKNLINAFVSYIID